MADTISEQQEILVKTLKNNGASLVGLGDVSVVGSELTTKLPVAVSIGIKYDENVVENLHADEAAFHKHLMGLNVPMRRLLSITEDLLSKWGYEYESMPISIMIESDKQLRELKSFPHKTAATCAGLGWVGKCALLVTPEYGPRIRLGTVLTDAPFKTAKPIVRDRCGKCSLCVEACPYRALHNVNWKRGVARDELFDAYSCNAKRLEYISLIGRKQSCGLCLQACNIGKKKAVSGR
jgi:epoxyqueuosine reductase QueG